MLFPLTRLLFFILLLLLGFTPDWLVHWFNKNEFDTKYHHQLIVITSSFPCLISPWILASSILLLARLLKWFLRPPKDMSRLNLPRHFVTRPLFCCQLLISATRRWRILESLCCGVTLPKMMVPSSLRSPRSQRLLLHRKILLSSSHDRKFLLVKQIGILDDPVPFPWIPEDSHRLLSMTITSVKALTSAQYLLLSPSRPRWIPIRLLRSWHQLPQSRLFLIGAFPCANNLTAYCDRPNVNTVKTQRNVWNVLPYRERTRREEPSKEHLPKEFQSKRSCARSSHGRTIPRYVNNLCCCFAHDWFVQLIFFLICEFLVSPLKLERFLVANREEYLRHSALNYTVQQKQYNNRLTDELLELATQHGYLFDTNDFSYVTVRDRIRCYFKSYVQSAKKRGILMGYAARKAGLLDEDELEYGGTGDLAPIIKSPWIYCFVRLLAYYARPEYIPYYVYSNLDSTSIPYWVITWHFLRSSTLIPNIAISHHLLSPQRSSSIL